MRKTTYLARYIAFLIYLTAAFECLAAADDQQIATVTRFYGDAKILYSPSDTLQGDGSHVLYEGKYYQVAPVKTGSKLSIGAIIQTGVDAKVRLVYDNGDQITIAASTAYQVTIERGAGESKPIIDIIFGKFRATISKEGPRSGMTVKTKTMSMGVRGTDFYIIAYEQQGGSKVSVLRGKVAVLPTTIKAAQPTEISAGYSANVPVAAATPPSGKSVGQPAAKEAVPALRTMLIKKTDKEELTSIQETSIVAKDVAMHKTTEKHDASVDVNIARLEAKAIETTLADIKKDDPTLYQNLAKHRSEIKDVDALQTITVKKVMLHAPEAPKPQKGAAKPLKPSAGDLPELQDNVYDKYFNN